MAIDPSTMRVALLAGGKSGEREVSLKSGAGCAEALKEAGFDVTMFDPAEKEDLKALIDGDFDVAFLTTHGRGGEDGTLQGFLETIGLKYTHPGVLASAMAINKIRAKEAYRAAGLPTPPSVQVSSIDQMTQDEIIAVVGEHCVVKAACEGSTIGIYMVEKAEELMPAIEKAFESDKEVLIEKFVAGREFTAPILGNDDAQALPLIEIIPEKNSFYDYESKYAAGGAQHICPAELPEDITAVMQGHALAAHKALGCRGVSRTDFLLEENGDMWILETNTIPGMTATSLLPDSAKAVGISYPELCTKLIELALE